MSDALTVTVERSWAADIDERQNADFPFLNRDVTPEALTALGGEYAEIADVAATNPLHAHFLAWGIYCRNGHPIFGQAGIDRSVSRGVICGDCRRDRWVDLDAEQEAPEGKPAWHCAVCGYYEWTMDEEEIAELESRGVTVRAATQAELREKFADRTDGRSDA